MAFATFDLFMVVKAFQPPFSVVATDWVLCDIRISGVHGGFAHGSMSLFAQDGELMATASQSLIVRVRERAEDR